MASYRFLQGGISFITALLISVTSTVSASDREAYRLLDRWKNTVRDSEKMSVQFKVWRFNHVFQTKETGEGTYYRDGSRFAWRWGTTEPMPVSALSAIKKEPFEDRPIHPLAVIYDGNSLAVGVGDPMLFEVLHQQSWASAQEPENVPTASHFWKKWFGPSQQVSWFVSLRFPFEISSFPELSNGKVHVIRDRTLGPYLRLTPQPGSILAKEISCVEAVFYPGEATPYAIRVVDPSGTVETRYLLKNSAFEESADIPVDAFQFPSSAVSTSEVTDLPRLLRTISHDPRD